MQDQQRTIEISKFNLASRMVVAHLTGALSKDPTHAPSRASQERIRKRFLDCLDVEFPDTPAPPDEGPALPGMESIDDETWTARRARQAASA